MKERGWFSRMIFNQRFSGQASWLMIYQGVGQHPPLLASPLQAIAPVSCHSRRISSRTRSRVNEFRRRFPSHVTLLSRLYAQLPPLSWGREAAAAQSNPIKSLLPSPHSLTYSLMLLRVRKFMGYTTTIPFHPAQYYPSECDPTVPQ